MFVVLEAPSDSNSGRWGGREKGGLIRLSPLVADGPIHEKGRRTRGKGGGNSSFSSLLPMLLHDAITRDGREEKEKGVLLLSLLK